MLESSYMSLDDIDRQILALIQEDGRISNAELARRLTLSPPATHARVRRLEREGFIEGYAGLVSRDKLGYDLLGFVLVGLTVHQFEHVYGFRERVLAMPEVLECYNITGEYDYLLKVVLRNREDLERFVVGELTPLPGVARLQTSLVLSEVKSSIKLPI
jgi:Lrp/AsnC family transcriptional regulator, leucine-responsive regulatory protein